MSHTPAATDREDATRPDPDSWEARIVRLNALWVSLRAVQAFEKLHGGGGWALRMSMQTASDKVEETFGTEWLTFAGSFELHKLPGYEQGEEWLWELIEEPDVSGASTGEWESIESVLRRFKLHPNP